MKFTRKASANWQGTGKEGKGTLSTGSTVVNNTQYSFSSRFEEGIGTNPEELVSPAHAGCFTMKLSFVLGENGFTPTSLDTKSGIVFEDGKITEINLKLTGVVPGIDAARFQELAAIAKETCPISGLLNTKINLETTLA